MFTLVCLIKQPRFKHTTVSKAKKPQIRNKQLFIHIWFTPETTDRSVDTHYVVKTIEPEMSDTMSNVGDIVWGCSTHIV